MTTIKIVQRPRANKDGKHPIALRITKNRKSKFILLNIAVKKTEFRNGKITSRVTDYLGKNQFLLNQEEKANKLIRDYLESEIDFTLDQFVKEFKGLAQKSMNVLEFFNYRLDVLYQLDRAGDARSIKNTRNVFFQFESNQNLTFKELNFDKLTDFELFLRKRNYTDGGIGARMRDLRRIYNFAIKKGIVKQEYSPFKHYKASRFKPGNSKRALTREQIKSIENLDLNIHPELRDAHNYFLFSYYTGGMNFKDLMLLTKENIVGERLVYQRAKTKQTFNIPIIPITRVIIDYYKTQNENTKYIFPILLHEGLTAKQIEERKAKKLKWFNKKLKALGKMAGIEEKITSYVIRHSFATNLYHAGESASIVKESMGHKSEEITNRYLKSFGNKVIDDAWKKLMKEPKQQYNAV